MKIDLRKNIRIFLYCVLFTFFLMPSIAVLIRNISEFELQLYRFQEILNFYKEFSDIDFSLILLFFVTSILCFVLFKLLHFFHVILSRKIGGRKALIIYSSVTVLLILDFVLEYPLLFNKEIIFPKSVETKYCFSSMEYQNSLSQTEITNIYTTILEKDSCFVFDSLSNAAGLFDCPNRYHSPIQKDMKDQVVSYWKELGFKNRFVSDYEEISKDGIVIDNFTFVVIGPIKKIDGNILIGYSEHSGPLSAVGYLIKLEKLNGKWLKEQFTIGWIS